MSITLEDLTTDLTINATSAYIAAQEAVRSFEALAKDPAARTLGRNKVFAYTGNILNVQIMPALTTAGMGKTATAHMIENASLAYADKGFGYVQAIRPVDEVC